MEYNLDELDVALSAATNQAADVRGPPIDHRAGTRTPGTRRGSLVPAGITSALPPAYEKSASNKVKKKRATTQPELNLFNYDLRLQVEDVLLTHGKSRVSYHEYAVFSPPENDSDCIPRSPSIISEGDEALEMFQNAIKHGHGLDVNGDFSAEGKGEGLLQGRVRQVIAYRRRHYGGGPALDAHTADGLVLTPDDYNSLGLHSATLPSIQRVTVESHFWNARRDTIYLILSFSNNPQPPYDFLSMTYKLKSKTTTALIRRSFDARWHHDGDLDEYERRLESSRSRWAHPLVLPIVLLQVQLYRTEEAVIENNGEVMLLEAHVDSITGTTGQANAEAWRRNQYAQAKAQSRREGNRPAPLRRLSTFKSFVGEKLGRRGNSGEHDHHHSGHHGYNSGHGPISPGAYGNLNGMGSIGRDGLSLNAGGRMDVPLSSDYVPPQTIHLMKEAHEVLKGAIQLLDTLRWMERAVKLIIQVGDELDQRHKELQAEDAERKRRKQTATAKEKPQQPFTGSQDSDSEDEDDLSSHWHEMRQYLDCTWRLCTSLETDRRMSELRCRAQIDIIYSKMAQEDNNLNARMAVASTRDSTSMKALAVITAIFLPGEYIGTLFGLSMFNWARGTAGDPAESEDNADWLPKVTVMPTFWIYWAFTIPLTLIIITAWRAWWISQDRFFRRHLSTELSSERYWTTDGQPRELETTFLQDFFSVLDVGGSRTTSNSAILGEKAAVSPGIDYGKSSAVSPAMGFELSRTRSTEKEHRSGGVSLLRREWTSALNRASSVSSAGGNGPPSATLRDWPQPPNLSASVGMSGIHCGQQHDVSAAANTPDEDDSRSIAMPLPTQRRFRTVSFAQQDSRARDGGGSVV